MLSANILILTLTLSYLAVSVQSDCECKSETCTNDDLKDVKKYLEALKKCEGKEEKAKKSCEKACAFGLVGTEAVKAIMARHCKIEDVDEMEEGEDKQCCVKAIDYLKKCIEQAKQKNSP